MTERIRRVLLLVSCLALGLGIGLVGARLTGSDMWFLAVPLCLAAGWFFVADPTQCTPNRNGKDPLQS